MRNTYETGGERKTAEQDGGVVAVTRALSLMEAFTVGESALSLVCSALTRLPWYLVGE